MFYQLHIYERGRDSLRSIFMGKGSAKRLLFNVEELIFRQSRGQFAKSFREGDKCFILQLGSNTYGSFLLISELIHGCRKDSIVVPEGKSGSGWRGFGLHLRKEIDPESLAPKQAITGIPKRDASKSFALVVAEEMKERIKLHWFKIQILEISAVIIVIPARKVFWDRGEDFVNNKWN